MDVVLETEERDGVLRLTMKGEGTGESARIVTEKYFAARHASRLDRVLVDLRSLEGRLSYPETYFFMRSIHDGPMPGRTAIVEREEHREWARFHEATSANAGFRVRYFFDLDEALAWLNS